MFQRQFAGYLFIYFNILLIIMYLVSESLLVRKRLQRLVVIKRRLAQGLVIMLEIICHVRTALKHVIPIQLIRRPLAEPVYQAQRQRKHRPDE